MKIKMLTREHIPCWYELGWRRTGRWPAIVLRIHRDILQGVPALCDGTPHVESYLSEHTWTFQGSFDRDWGFNSALRFKGISGGFAEFHAPLPRVKELTDRLCLHCNGSGWEEYRPERCIGCDGIGRESFYNWDRILPLSASLALLTQIVAFPKAESSSPLSQLIRVELFTSRSDDMERFSLGGEHSVPLVAWMSSLGVHIALPEMVDAMKVAYARMMGKEDSCLQRFRASIDSKNGWLNTDCPGNACGLHPA